MKNIELLAPAGDFECVKAAVQNGADSIYFGGNLFNARASATNFDLNELKKVIDYCTIRNVKTNLTLNTLIKDSEFEEAVNLAVEAYKLGIDAIIVQDLGLAKYLIDNFPDLPIHASTQMTIHNLEGAQEAQKLGFKRVVLSRELSIQEIEYICANTDVEIETFIHGALCVCYSGQCLFSSMIGGRSGNRGKCAQPCRLPYSLISKSNNDEKVLDKGYLLSTKDLCGLEFLPRLIKAGVKCFKIEGRLKNPEYVATVTRIYRKYIDMVLNNQEYVIDENDKKDLLQVFNRGGFSSGHLDNSSNKNLVYKETPGNIGIYVGTVSNYNSNKGHIKLKLEDNLSIGDSITFEKESSKYTVSELMIENTNLTTCNSGNKVTIGRMKGNISAGDKIFKISSKELSSLAKQSYENAENKKIMLNCSITIKKNQPISMNIVCDNNLSSNYNNIKINISSNIIPVEALKTPITADRIKAQISKTNNTPFTFKNITVDLDDGLYIPSISAINELRRTALEKLEKTVVNNKSKNTDVSLSSNLNLTTSISSKYLSNPQISLFLRFLFKDYDYSKLDKTKIDKIYLPLKLFLDKNNSDIINYLCTEYKVYIYIPTIIRANFRNIILNSLEKVLENFNVKGFVLSNLADFKGLEKYKKDYEFIGNYSLNVFNTFSLEQYNQLGLNMITLSRELNKEDLQKILSQTNINTELIVYGNSPIMAINYCLLGKANKCYPTCDSNCSKNNTYYLKDRLGYNFRIIPDNLQTVSLIHNSKTLSISTKDLPINHVRADFIDESIDEINKVIEHIYNREKLEGNQYTNGNFNREI